MIQDAKAVQDRSYNKVYYNAWGYAFKLDKSEEYKDLVHDAYLRWYDKNGRDLFLEHKGTIARVIHYTWLDKLKRNKIMYNGELFAKIYMSKDEEESPERFITRTTPEDEVIHKEESSYRSKSESPYHQEVIRLLLLGYTNSQIVQELGLNPNTVSRHLMRYRSGFTQFINS